MDEIGEPPPDPWRAFLENRNFVAGTLRTRDAAPPRAPGDDLRGFDLTALTALGDVLRGAGYDNTPAGGALARFSLGFTVDRSELVGPLSEAVLSGLSRSGTAVEDGTALRLRGAILRAGQVLAYVPRDGLRPDLVYVGPDTAFLMDAATRLGGIGRRGCAVDLGTGTGVVAAALAADHRIVVAADVTIRSVRTARLTAALNRFPTGHVVAPCRADVARGLRPAAFDLVCANTPWVPSGDGSTRRVFADGGHTGFELPRRFLLDAPALLRPGGVMVALTAALTFDDGRSPLEDACAVLDRDGFTSAVLPTGFGRDGGIDRVVLPRVPGAVAATHVAVVIGRGSFTTGVREALAELTDLWAARAGAEPTTHAGGRPARRAVVLH